MSAKAYGGGGQDFNGQKWYKNLITMAPNIERLGKTNRNGSVLRFFA